MRGSQRKRAYEGYIAFAGVILFLLFLHGFDGAFRLEKLDRVSSVQTSDVATGTLPLAPGARERSLVLRPSAMDARWWTIHAETALAKNSFRVRHSTLDNAPDGRDTHWSSSIIGLVRALDLFRGSARLKNRGNGLADVVIWVGPVIFGFSLVGLGMLASLGGGLRCGALLMLLFGTSTFIASGFRLGETDHHGLLQAFSAGFLLSLGFASFGGMIAARGRSAGFWAIASGILGAAALWVSAASFLPILAATVFSLLVGMLLDLDLEVDPRVWRVWAFFGAGFSLLFYLLEYFPYEMAWRLEVIHPLYALAWAGVGDWLCRVAEMQRGGRLCRSPLSVAAAAASLVAMFLPFAAILGFGEQCFRVGNPFLLLLHTEYILEFRSMSNSLAGQFSWGLLLEGFGWPLFVLSAFLLGTWGKAFTPAGFRTLKIILIPAALIQALAFYQVRWHSVAASLWMVAVVFLFLAYLAGPRPSKALAGCLFLVVAIPNALVFPAWDLLDARAASNPANGFPKIMAPTLILRDIAHRLVQSSPHAVPLVLTDPTSSTELAYYGGIRTIGTLYWENLSGLRKTAELFHQDDAETLRDNLQSLGVSHLLLCSWDPSLSLLPQLLFGKGGTSSLLQKLIKGDIDPPDWLRPLSYTIPSGFGLPDERVSLFQFAPEQSPSEAIFFRALLEAQQGSLSKAKSLLESALATDPANQRATMLLRELSTPKH